MTIKEYILSITTLYGFDESALIDATLIGEGIDGGQAFSPETKQTARLGLYEVIPLLFALPDIQEAGFSITRNIEGLKKYYSLVCAELGKPDKTKSNQVVSKSYMW
jgi:hypothetical protein